MTDPHHESTPNLISEAFTRVTSLVRSEFDLARAEMDQNMRRAGTALGMIVAAGVIALTALNVLAAALVAALNEMGIEGGWSALIVGVVLAIIAYVLLSKGTSDLRLSSLAPSRTAENIKRDAQAVQGEYNAQ